MKLREVLLLFFLLFPGIALGILALAFPAPSASAPNMPEPTGPTKGAGFPNQAINLTIENFRMKETLY